MTAKKENASTSNNDIDENEFDQLPSLFPAELSKNVQIFTIKPWQKLKLVMKRVGKALRVSILLIVYFYFFRIIHVLLCVVLTSRLKNALHAVK